MAGTTDKTINKILEQTASNLGYPVFDNQWTLSDTTNDSEEVEYQVRSVSLPNLFPKFQTESLPTGVQYYSSVQFDRDWSVTIEEDVGMGKLDYFQKWATSIYDQDELRFNLANGAYVRNFTVRLYSPAAVTSNDFQTIKQNRVTNWGTTVMEEVVNSCLGRLAQRASNFIGGTVASGQAGLTLFQRGAVYPVDMLSESARGVVSYGVDMLRKDTNLHSDIELMTVSLNGCILKEIDKLDLDYQDGSPIQYKISLACDSAKVSYVNDDLLKEFNI